MPQLFGIMIIIAIGVCFLVTLYTIVLRFEETANQYFIDHAYANVTFYGAFDDESVSIISEFDGVLLAQGRRVHDFRENEKILRAISLTDDINILYLYSGRKPQDDMEGAILKRNAEAMSISIGDELTIGDKTIVITGIASAPEYIFMVQNKRIMMAQPNSFGVVFVTEAFFAEGYNEIIALTDSNFCIDNASDEIVTFNSVLQKDQTNYDLYITQLDILRTFAYIFPFVFAVLIAIVIYVMLSRAIQKERKQIGTMKALGVSDITIIGIYLSQFCFTALIGGILGCVAATYIGDVLIGIFSYVFEVPTLTFVVYLGLWIPAIITSILLCAISGLIALLSILTLLPAHAMRPRQPRGGKRTSPKSASFLWNQFSFNTRYTLKSALRNKGRFLAVSFGMCGTCLLLSFSLGYNNSITNTQNRYFNGFANYDVIINLDLFPLYFNHPVLRRVDDSYKSLIMPIEIQDERYVFTIVENGFDMFHIPSAALQNGIIIPENFADKWGAQVGDKLKISEIGSRLEIDDYYAIVSAIIPQHLGPMLITSFDYINSVTDDISSVYNTIFGKSRNMEALSLYLTNNDIDFTTIDDDRASFESIMEVLSIVIWLMIILSTILGVTVLYSVGMINLSAREYEYMFMGVMGYPRKSILMAHAKETIIQLVFAIPLGFYFGNLLLKNTEDQFSSNSFVLSGVIFPQSYFISSLLVISVTAFMAFVTSHHIERLDVVDGLKVQDD